MTQPGVAWVRPSKLLWLLVLALGLGAVWFFGTPHLLWTYRYRESGGARFYLSCDYLGRHTRRIHPVEGACPLIMFLKAEGEPR